MRDAFGGIVNIAIIVVFLVIVSGYLAFNVNYTKAFRVKNKIISTYEEYEGACQQPNGDCRTKIREYINDVGYNAGKMRVSDTSFACQDEGYCVKKVRDTTITDGEERAHFEIITQININIPIINNIMGLSIFQVRGSTKTIVIPS